MAIRNVFSIGRTCYVDDLMKDMEIRNYSSPFSYMGIDLETSLYFIENGFKGFTDVIHPEIGYYMNEHPAHNYFLNTHFMSEDKQLANWDRICVYKHHDLSDNNVLTSFISRQKHLYECIKRPDTLLIYIDKRRTTPVTYSTELLNNFIEKYGCQMFIVVHCETHSGSPTVVYESDKLRMIQCMADDYRGIRRVMEYLYTFDIEMRPDCPDSEHNTL